MTDWPIKTLGGVATIATGKIDVNAATEDGAYPFFTCSRDTYRIDDAPFEGKAILVAGNGDLNVKYYEGRFNAYQRTYFLFARDETNCYPRYLFWFLENYLDVLRSGASGSTIKYIRLGDLSEASVPMPPLEEQIRIVELLDVATARVTELSACYEQARTHANNLFASALREELEGNSDWPVKTIGNICIGIDRQDPAISGQSKFTYIDLSAVNQATKQIDDFTILAVDEAPGRARQIVKVGDVLVSTVRPNLNAVALVGSEFNGATASTGFCVLRSNRSIVEPGILFAWAQNQLFIEQLTSQAKGASYPAVTDNVVKALEIPMPPLDEQKRIVARLDSMRAKTSEMTAAYDAKMTAAKNLRQSILEAAFAGQL